MNREMAILKSVGLIAEAVWHLPQLALLCRELWDLPGKSDPAP